VLRAVILAQYWRVTDRQTDGQTDGRTDGIAIANTALAMRALHHAVKTETEPSDSFPQTPTFYACSLMPVPKFHYSLFETDKWQLQSYHSNHEASLHRVILKSTTAGKVV